MTTQELKNIAKANDLELVKVGNFDEAITGFKNFAQAEKIAEENELDIVIIRKKGNGNFEYDCGGVYKAIDVLEQYKQTNKYTLFFKGDAEHFQEVDIDETLQWMKEDEASEEEIAEFLKERNEIKARIESLTDEQFIALDCANTIYSEALNKEDVCYYDSHSDIYYQIALM
nr:MAG TPA: Ras-related protein Rab-8A, RILP-like protein trafficking, Rab GTPase, effector [Caudoviricetes sp.]